MEHLLEIYMHTYCMAHSQKNKDPYCKHWELQRIIQQTLDTFNKTRIPLTNPNTNSGKTQQRYLYLSDNNGDNTIHLKKRENVQKANKHNKGFHIDGLIA